jgi:hypothetical protein
MRENVVWLAPCPLAWKLDRWLSVARRRVTRCRRRDRARIARKPVDVDRQRNRYPLLLLKI